MKYNIGDKFLCINNFEDDYDKYSEIVFTKGKYYTISSIDDFEIFIMGDDSEEYYFTIDIMSPYYLYKYFKDIREDRKDKLLNLKKLKDVK